MGTNSPQSFAFVVDLVSNAYRLSEPIPLRHWFSGFTLDAASDILQPQRAAPLFDELVGFRPPSFGRSPFANRAGEDQVGDDLRFCASGLRIGVDLERASHADAGLADLARRADIGVNPVTVVAGLGVQTEADIAKTCSVGVLAWQHDKGDGLAVRVSVRALRAVGRVSKRNSAHVHAGMRMDDRLDNCAAVRVSRAAPPGVGVWTWITSVGRVIDSGIVWAIGARAAVGVDFHTGFVDESFRSA